MALRKGISSGGQLEATHLENVKVQVPVISPAKKSLGRARSTKHRRAEILDVNSQLLPRSPTWIGGSGISQLTDMLAT